MLIHQDYLKFMSIYEEKSLSKAAEKLDLYQGALSKLLKKIEFDLNQPLFIRTNRGLIPTEFSKRLYGQVKEQSLLWKNFNSCSEEKELSGTLRFGGHPIILKQFDSNLSKLLLKNKNLNLKFSFNRSSEVTRRILNFDLEFGLVIKPKSFDDLIIRPLHTDQTAMFSQSKKYNTSTVIYNPELIDGEILSKRLPRSTRLLANANLSLSVAIAKKMNCSIIIPKNIALNYGFKHQLCKPLSSHKVFLIYRAEQKLSINTQLILNEF